MYTMLIGRSTAINYNLSKLAKPSISSIRYLSSETQDYKPGDVIHGYKVEAVDYIKELNIKPYLLKHEATGAEHLHIYKDGDRHNVFNVSLRTTPKSSNGVAHILEHIALCGSKQYAVRDPFFKMTTRSLATFMNAMTGSDFTCYPFSTQNKKDFENLLSVYLDAVFFPRLRPVDFRQEGWRLEHEQPDKKETPIVLRGVVYNEMKGVFSSSSSIYMRRLLNNLFPDTTYQHESGGDPENIPDLSHEELAKFHKLHYHPSNSKFFTYGDIPLESHLKLISETVMTRFSENSQAREQSMVIEQEPWKQPRTVEISCPPDPLSAASDKQTTTSISYMLPTTNTNLEDIFALQILESLLIGGPNAPFYKSLKESGLGSDFSPSTGIGTFTKQPYFSIGLQNIKKSDIKKVHDIIEKTLIETAKEGFPQERIDALLHKIELGLKHVSGNFGLRLVMNIESFWNHEGDVIEYLKVNKYVDKFRQALASDKQYWNHLIHRHFLNNKHRLVLNMTPDDTFKEQLSKREQELLQNKVSKLSEVDRQALLYEGMELMKLQDKKDNPNILPCLEPSKDISRDLDYRTQLKFEQHKGVNIQICEQPTNEVVYFRAMTNIGPNLTNDLIDYVPLFCDVATQMGAGSYDRHKFAQQVQLTTGGFGISNLLNTDLNKFDSFKNEICFGSYCLRRNVSSMFELWSNVFKQIHFEENKDYLMQLIKANAAELADGISYSGQAYAMKRSAAQLSRISSLDERLSGLSYVTRMKDMASKESLEEIVSKLRRIATIACDTGMMKCAINAEPDAIGPVMDELRKFIESANRTKSSDTSAEMSHFDWNVEQEETKFPFSTHFVAKSLITVPKLHKDYSKLVIMSKLISSKYLLREVREKGGAYGAGARLSGASILQFFSYRDPNTTKTLEIFDRAADWVADEKEYTDVDIEESKLGVFQDVDRPVEPGKRGLGEFVSGETDEIREEYRRRLLDVNKDDVKKVAQKYLRQKKFGTFII